MCIVDKKISCIKTTPRCIQKKKLKLCFCVWKLMTWPRIFESTFPSKILSHISWKTAQICKMLSNSVPLTIQKFEHNDLSPEFPAVVSSLNLLKGSCLFREHLKFIQFKSCVKKPSHYFYCFNGFTDNLLKSVTMVMCQMSIRLNLVYMCCYYSLSTNHVGYSIMTLNFPTR